MLNRVDMIKRLSRHLTDNNISYVDHMIRAQRFIFRLLKAIIVLNVHAFLPFVWETKASEMIEQINSDMKSI